MESLGHFIAFSLQVPSFFLEFIFTFLVICKVGTMICISVGCSTMLYFLTIFRFSLSIFFFLPPANLLVFYILWNPEQDMFILLYEGVNIFGHLQNLLSQRSNASLRIVGGPRDIFPSGSFWGECGQKELLLVVLSLEEGHFLI